MNHYTINIEREILLTVGFLWWLNEIEFFLPASHVLAGYTGQLTQLVIIIISLNIFI